MSCCLFCSTASYGSLPTVVGFQEGTSIPTFYNACMNRHLLVPEVLYLFKGLKVPLKLFKPQKVHSRSFVVPSRVLRLNMTEDHLY